MTQLTDAYLFEQIAESIRLQIARGELQAGDRLPSIRDLAQEWGCTPGTVNRAYVILSDEGMVSSRRGGGTTVNANALLDQQPPLRSAILVNQIEGLLLSLLNQGYAEAEVESAFSSALARWHALREMPPGGSRRSAENRLRFVGSHDLAIDLLAQQLAAQSDSRLNVAYRGSLGGLIALSRGEADIAGSHLWDEQSDEYNVPFVQRVLPGRRVALVTVAGRSFGLILPVGNPQEISTLADLTRPDVRWVNRQQGSGTRVWLDAQLRRLGVETAEIDGFNDVRTTHSEVAEAIHDGAATAGLGIFAAASALGLDFVPFAQEQYQLVIPEAVMETAVCQTLLAILQTESFKEAVAGFGGYQVEKTGEINWVE